MKTQCVRIYSTHGMVIEVRAGRGGEVWVWRHFESTSPGLDVTRGRADHDTVVTHHRSRSRSHSRSSHLNGNARGPRVGSFLDPRFRIRRSLRPAVAALDSSTNHHPFSTIIRQTVTHLEDIPFSDCFNVKDRFVITPTADGGLKFQVGCQTKVNI